MVATTLLVVVVVTRACTTWLKVTLQTSRGRCICAGSSIRCLGSARTGFPAVWSVS